ncbi:serine/threonine-protein kinase [Streptomyces sp. NPDC000594]|uniref:serine/threonine-protein kinase n=1 Tax=Streptomyces sp. NPDC000594 TaxID=3154261 RepID=UPI0033336E54
MGEVFAGRYELVDPIGRGGVGAVWRAWDHRRRRYVAAKVLQQSDAHTLLRFVREQALRIDHPHVLAPASWAADDDKVLFTMDLVSGGSLAHVIGDYGPLPPRYVCTLLDQLLSGLAAVHAEGVVHRDIKPANILMEATGTGRPHLRLSDFGISMRKGEPRLTETNYVVGTPGYFAPEQVEGAEPDFPADLFAAGLVALYLLEGQKPDAKALVDFFTAHGTPGAPQGIPEALWQVLAGLIQPDPDLRFRTATGARKALASAVELLPETGPDDEPVEIFDQLGPLPPGFGPEGPEHTPSTGLLRSAAAGTAGDTGSGPWTPSRPAPGAPGSPGTPGAPAAPGAPSVPAPRTHQRPSPNPPVPMPPPLPGTPEPSGGTPTGGRPPAPAGPHHPETGGTPALPGSYPAHPPATGGFPVPPPPVPPPHPAPPAAPPPTPPSSPVPLPQEPTPQHPVTAQGTRYSSAPEQPPGHSALVPFTEGYHVPAPLTPARPPAVRPARRPQGPPAKVVIPVLLLALVCFTVGFWALVEA